jgi:cysteinyl-tRNA synthetase
MDPDFIIIPQNGQELITHDSSSGGSAASDYLQAINGQAREDLLFGYDNDNVPTPPQETQYMTGYLNRAEEMGIQTLVIDYCWDQAYVDSSYIRNNRAHYISYAASHRELDNIPIYPVNPYNMNSNDIDSLQGANNFLYLINPDLYPSKDSLINTLRATNFDLLILDLFYDDTPLTAQDISSLRTKAGGGRRLILAYMSIGEAEDYRYYWQASWQVNPPAWLVEENPDWPGNYAVEYWNFEWQNIFRGNDSSYCKKILDSGFDGVYLDIIDAFEYFE